MVEADEHHMLRVTTGLPFKKCSSYCLLVLHLTALFHQMLARTAVPASILYMLRTFHSQVPPVKA